MRQKKIKIYYLIAVIIGISTIPCWIFSNYYLALILALSGIIILQIGRFERLKWRRIYENLMYVRTQRQSKVKEDLELKEKKKHKYHAINKEKLQ
jgi:hypothetical protein